MKMHEETPDRRGFSRPSGLPEVEVVHSISCAFSVMEEAKAPAQAKAKAQAQVESAAAGIEQDAASGVAVLQLAVQVLQPA